MGIIVYTDEKKIPVPDNFVKILEEYYSEDIGFYFMFKKEKKHLRKIKEFIDFFQELLR